MLPAGILPTRTVACRARLPYHQPRVNYYYRQFSQRPRFARISSNRASSSSSSSSLGSVRYQSGGMAAKRNEYMVVMPDKPGMLQKRIEVRDTHLNNLGPIIDSGFIKVGGAMFDHHPKEGEVPSMKGSMLVVAAESEQEIRETLAKDIYATSGVWDIDNMQITPFKSALRLPL